MVGKNWVVSSIPCLVGPFCFLFSTRVSNQAFPFKSGSNPRRKEDEPKRAIRRVKWCADCALEGPSDVAMATVAETFLADLDDLSDEEREDEEMEEVQEEAEQERRKRRRTGGVQEVAKLRSTERYQRVLEDVRRVRSDESKIVGEEAEQRYNLVLECNKIALEIENELFEVHNYIKDMYRTKFPELESMVNHPIDYARVVKRIGNEMDVTRVDLDGLLPSATIMVVTVTGSTTSGKELDEVSLQQCMEACEEAFALDEDKKTVLKFVESSMTLIAPNLSIVLGTEIAAKIIGIAGGVEALSKIPACNVQVLGAKKRNLAGFSSAGAAVQPHQGFVFECPIIQQTPPALRNKAARLVGSKCALLARFDAFGDDRSGSIGEKMKEEIVKKIEKWQEPPPAKIAKPLQVPDMEPKKRRGGKRYRKMKERYGVSDMGKLQNRVQFNQAEEEIIDGDEMVGMGMVGQENSGRLRVQMKKSNLASKAAKKLAKVQNRRYGTAVTSGLSSSIAFTPIQGIELENPHLKMQADKGRSGTESYFSESGGFSALPKK